MGQWMDYKEKQKISLHTLAENVYDYLRILECIQRYHKKTEEVEITRSEDVFIVESREKDYSRVYTVDHLTAIERKIKRAGKEIGKDKYRARVNELERIGAELAENFLIRLIVSIPKEETNRKALNEIDKRINRAEGTVWGFYNEILSYTEWLTAQGMDDRWILEERLSEIYALEPDIYVKIDKKRVIREIHKAWRIN